MTNINANKLFDNIFDDKNITDTRICDFTFDHLQRLTNNNTGGRFTGNITNTQTLVNALFGNINTIDVTLAQQKGATQTVDSIMDSFHQTMSDKEGVIAAAVGGFSNPVFLEFYPHGVSEYAKITKTNAQTLMKRVSDAAGNHSAALGTTMVTLLQSFYTNYNTSRAAQQTKISTVDTQRGSRDNNRTPLELQLLKNIGLIQTIYPGDPVSAGVLFNFSMLYAAAPHHQHKKFSGDLMDVTPKNIVDLLMDNSYRIQIRNTSTVQDFYAALMDNAAAAPPNTSPVIHAGKSVTFVPSQLGDVHNAFLNLMNVNGSNNASYEIDIYQVS